MKRKEIITSCLHLLLIGIFCSSSYAQDSLSNTHAIQLTGRSFGTSVKLRWAPTSLYAWKESNQSGYVVERYTILRDGEMVPYEERIKAIRLTDPVMKALPEGELWKPLVAQSDYAAIAAQALYGKSFTTAGSVNPLLAQRDEQENRFSFGLFAADQSIAVAEALGLYMEDSLVKMGEQYLYKVYPAEQTGRFPIDTGLFYVATEDVFELPKIVEVEVEFGDRLAYISWDKTLFAQFYTSYVVERATGEGNFAPVNALPYVGMDENATLDSRTLMMDSLDVNDQLYHYRVRGRTIFEELGPPSDPVQGMGINPKVGAPAIESISNSDAQKLGIAWAFDESQEKEINGFQLQRSSREEGPYELISGTQLIDKTLRYFMDEDPLPVNYYRIVAMDKYSRYIFSFPALAQMEDSTPPAPPKELRGTIMNDGTMVLTWAQNEEPDIMGYRVYLSNLREKEEYVQITSEPVRQNFYSYTVPMNTLSEEVYIKLRAIDFRQNKSDFSTIATIVRPDSLPPAAAVFVSAKSSDKGITLQWENSASGDVVNLLLQRRKKMDALWEDIRSLSMPQEVNTRMHVDTSSERGVPYSYRLQAIDDAGLKTNSRVIQAQKTDTGIRRPIQKISTEVDRKSKRITLNWQYQPDGDDLSHFIIYRAAENGRLKNYASIPKNAALKEVAHWQYEDRNLKMDAQYQYQIRVMYASGAQSPLSSPIKVDY